MSVIPFRFHAVVLSALIAAILPVAASAATIEFRVRMGLQIERGAFEPGADVVDVAGTFNAWGSDPLTTLSDADGDSIHEVVVDGFTPGEEIEFKFRINAQWDGTEEFPGVGNNRRYTVQEGTQEILVWYDDREPDLGTGELEWWNDTVFYEIFVRSFQDSDGDGIGDFQGLTQRLDYLNDGDPNTDDDLGVTGIWLMPINDSPSYHGYDVVDYRSINPDYGTLADFQAFLAAAHARGIRVIIDYVMNHASNQHPWFIASANGDPTYRDWFVWEADDPGQTGPWGQDVWHRFNADWYYGLFWSGMPDLNYDAPALKAEMFDTATWWLDTIGVDGFRLDAVLYIDETNGQLESTQETLDFWREFNLHVKSVEADGLSVGEAWTGSSVVNQYVIDDRLDLAFEFELAGSILGSVLFEDTVGLSWKARDVFELYPYGQFATFLTNHDQDRAFDVLGQDEGRMRVAAGIYLTLPGVPFLYYGEEVGQLGTKPDPDIRRPMQWTDGPNAGFTTGTPWRELGPNAATNNVQTMASDANSLWSWYRDLIAVRQATPALRRGDLERMESSQSPVLAFLRRYEQQTVLVLANTSPVPQSDVAVTSPQLSVGSVQATDLLDGGAPVELQIDQDGRIDGLQIDGHDVLVLELATATDVDGPRDGSSIDTGLWLAPNAPDPVGSATTIRYALPRGGHVELKVFDAAGRAVAVLEDGTRDAGQHLVQWSGRDDRGRRLAAGVYFLRLQASGDTRVDKMVLLD